MSDSTLVVGASGILAPLVRRLGDRGAPVIAVSRRGAAVPGAHRALAADATEPSGVAAIAAAGPFAAAVVYGPAVDADGEGPQPALLAAVRGHAVLVVTSAAADPATVDDPAEAIERSRSRPGDRVLLLGWSTTPDGESRWHTPDEVSDAALAILDSGGDEILGAVRPWNERPEADT